MKPRRSQPIEWSPDLAYVVGLITTDGSLSIDGRHIDFTSQDIQLLQTFKNCLNLKCKIGYKSSGYSDKRCSRLQFGDVQLYKWFLEIGLTPNKTKTVGALNIPDQYFFDFLRGHFDGDGSCYSYWDPRWESSFMFYITFNSASLPHLRWIRKRLMRLINVGGYINRGNRLWQLKFAKQEGKLIIQNIYHSKKLPCLERKYEKLKSILEVDSLENARVVKQVNTLA